MLCQTEPWFPDSRGWQEKRFPILQDKLPKALLDWAFSYGAETDKSESAGGKVITAYNEAFAGNKVVTAYNLYDYQNKIFDNVLDSVFGLGMKITQKTGWLSPMMHIVVSVGIAAVLGLGSYMIVKGTITSGNFVSFITALIMLYTPIKLLGNNAKNMQII